MTVHFYFYHLEQNGKEYIGFGVTKNPTKRHKDHISNFSKGGVTCRDYRYMACKSKIEAIDLENKAKAIVPFSGLDVPGFKTESIPIEKIDEFKALLDSVEFGPISNDEAFSSTQYYRMKRLNLNPSNRNAKIADIAFDPKEACRAIQQLLEIRSILKSYNVCSKIELESLLAYATREDV